MRIMANQHFGNIGDVWKHVVLAEVLEREPPAWYAETHAGSAAYAVGSQRRARVWLRAFPGGRSAVPRSGPVAIPRSRRFLPRGRTSPVPGLRAAGDDAARRYRLLPAV